MSNTTTAPTVFKFHTHEVRTITKDGEPWFVASDVCKALNLTNSRVMLKSLDHDEKGVSPTYTLGGTQNVAVVNESGLYTLVLRCRDAVKSGTVPHQFRKWVTSEVIPAIRKTGEYSIPYAVGPHDVLTAAQAEQLRVTLKIACDKLPKEKQAGFMIKAWSKMKSHFGVSYRNIPQREFTEALSLAGRHAAEWEIVDEPKPERRQLLVERDGVTTVIDATGKSLVSVDRIHALRRDFKAMQDAMVEMSHRMRICFGDINASDLIEPLTVNLDQAIVGMPAQRRAA